MPVYEFKCHGCSTVSEIFVRSIHGPEVHCPECGCEDMEKLITSSYMIKTESQAPGSTCCGRSERCERPPCSTGETCHRQ